MNLKWMRGGMLIAAWIALGGCAALQPVEVEQAQVFALDPAFEGGAAASPDGPVLAIGRVREDPGFDSARMAYVRKPHELEYFARNKWVDAPGKMLAPLLERALESSGAFRAVLPSPGTVAGDFRLDAQVVRLQQEFLSTPSVVRLTLRAQLVDLAAKRIVATRQFEAVEAATGDDPYGGVVAANRAVRRVLGEVAAFCASAAKR